MKRNSSRPTAGCDHRVERQSTSSEKLLACDPGRTPCITSVPTLAGGPGRCSPPPSISRRVKERPRVGVEKQLSKGEANSSRELNPFWKPILGFLSCLLPVLGKERKQKEIPWRNPQLGAEVSKTTCSLSKQKRIGGADGRPIGLLSNWLDETESVGLNNNKKQCAGRWQGWPGGARLPLDQPFGRLNI